MLRNNPHGEQLEIFGTHLSPVSIVLQVCDHYELETEEARKDYINYGLDFCRRNNIGYFIPRHAMMEIAANISLFEKEGVRVMICAESSIINLMGSKSGFYEECRRIGIIPIPEYHTVTNADQFLEAYNALSARGHRVCFKPVVSEGGFGFRVIEPARTMRSIMGDISYKVALPEVMELLQMQESFKELMVMEYLDGYEYSIDCLAYDGELLAAVPRKKVDGRIRMLEQNEELIEIAGKIAERYKLSYIFNVQVKYRNGTPYLLEVNPRMSGGLHISCLSGINFPYEAFRLLAGEGPKKLHPRFGTVATQVEKEFVMRALV